MWDRLHRELLRRLNALGRLDWSAGVVDGSHIRALRGGPLTGRSPVDRGRSGSKHHLIVDCHGVPLAATLTGGHRNDVTQLLPLVDGIGAIAGKRGRPRRRPERLIADRLRIRWARNARLHYAFLSLGCSLICWRHIRP